MRIPKSKCRVCLSFLCYVPVHRALVILCCRCVKRMFRVMRNSFQSNSFQKATDE